jgi:hypothetical protein
MVRKAMIMVVVVGCGILSVGHELGAELKKARTGEPDPRRGD